MHSYQKAPRHAARRFALGVPFLLLAVACASMPPPTENLSAAQQAIANAERVDAATHAAVELGEARAKLASANAAVSEKQMIVAQQLADESRAEAELAAARSTVAKANAVNKDMKRSTETLIEEMQRKTGDNK
ncbi:MAG: DUF4398 domain-containing protein [Pseudomonadota bacterium]